MSMVPLGGAVVSDFDGTLAVLEISWPRLRERLAVARIEELWKDPDMQRWDTVAEAEIEAARAASPVPSVVRALESVADIAVLTSNDEVAVAAFLERWPELRSRVRVVVGRRTLAGPKTDFEIFSAGYAKCLHAISGPGPAPVTYIGDQDYELDFARRLGADAVGVRELESAAGRPGKA
jgi:phosphoglycolate phosphatase-like HAD superfamily hydrolase